MKIFKYSPLMLIGVVLSAQTISFTMDECIELGRKQGPGAAALRQELVQIEADFLADEARYKPQLTLSGEAPGLNRSINSITQPDGSVKFLPQSQMYSSLNLNLMQRLTFSGGSVYLSSGLRRVDLFGNTDDFYYQSSPLVAGIEQPLFQANENRYQRELNRRDYELKKRQLLDKMLRNDREIIQAYFGAVVAAMEMEISKVNLAVNDSIYYLSQRRYDVGRIAENELLESELARMNAQLSLSTASSRHEMALLELKLILGLTESVNLHLALPPAFPKIELNENEAVSNAREYSLLHLQHHLSQFQYQYRVKQARAARKPDITLSASAGFDQTAQTFPNLFRNLLNQQRLTLRLNMPLWNAGERKARILENLAMEKAADIHARYDEALYDQQIRHYIRELLRLQKQLEVAARADTIAIRRFDVARNRYLIGKVNITSLLLAQESQNSARKNYYTSLQLLWLSYYDLKRSALWDFELNKPITIK
ncbi:MAG TPA: TolC family protein [Candidatus Marinimicrobia bacterium]|mgnify:CR=1 FL=1|nr:TolC family protein [Candidatus Neomarinimicrobiota bacterium]